MSQKKFLDKIGLQNFLNRIKALIPTKTSELQNDSGFITSEGTYDSALSLESEKAVQNKVVTAAINGKQDTLSTAQTNAVDSGITSAKVQGYDSHISDTDIHVTQADKTSWDSKASGTHTHLASEVSGLSTVATSGSYNDLSNKPSIPSKTSDLTNDSGFLTSHNPVDSALSSTSTNAVQNKVINNALTGKSDTGHTHLASEVSGLSTVATSGSYSDLTNKPTIDSALSSTSTNAVQNKVINTELGKKANTTDLATVATSGSYADLSNKPTIPTVNNATLTIQKNGTTVKTFTANSSTNVTADITVPTKVSELTNDSGFLTSHNPVDSALSTTSENAVQNKVIKAELDLKANSADLSTVATTGSYFDLNNIPSNFTPASHTHGSITNDGKLGTASRVLITDGNKKIAVSSVTSTELGYLSGVTSAVQDQLDGKAASTHSHTASEVSGLATVATSGSYNDLTNKPTIPTVNNATLTIQKNGTTVKTFTANASSNVTANITVPTKVSELTNDSGFLTSHNPVDSTLSDTSTNAVQNKVVKAELDGKSDTGHTHTASEVSGLSTVATSGSYNDLTNKPTIPTVNNATLTIQKNGSTVKTFTANASSNVTANITVPTKVSELTNDSGFLTSASNLDSSKLTGTIDIARLPKGALERLVTVADQTARFALTTSDVQLGDTVKQLDTGVMYIVTDESKLSSADGYTEYTAGAATSVPWSGVTGKPSSYTPASHSHGNIANGGTLGTASRALITDGNKKITTSSVTSTELGYVSGVTSAIQTQLDGKAASSHTHTASEVSGLSTVATSGSYNDLSNKPTIPTVNNATLTIQKNGSTVKTFTANASSNVTANITVPTKTSDLTNDSHQTITVGTDTTSTASPAHSGTFTCIDSVTRDSNGHVTAVNTKTVTLPADNNTDTLVTQNVSTANENHPVLLTVTKDATANQGAKTSIFASGVKVNPSTNTVTATTFSGALSGNASTATQFSANKAVTLTGDVTGTASSKAGWSVATTLADSGVTAGTYGPSADVTGNNNATISVPEITVDSKGRVTSVANRTLTCKNNTYNVYNKTLTIQKNGTNVATFTSNSNTDVTANITVPTKTSELTNDSGYLTSHQSLSNYVTLNGTQTITGAKTFTGGVTLSNTAKMTVNHATVVKGTNPSSVQYWQIFNCDKNGGNWGTNTLSIIEGALDANGKSSIYFRACKNEANSTASGTLAVVYDSANNKTWAECPTPAASSNDTKIATTAWVNSKGYLTSHQSLSNYSTLANTVKSLSISGKTITVTPGSGNAYTLTTQDTVYTHPTTAGNKHIPSGGSANQYLKYSASGTAAWATIKTSEITNDSGFIPATRQFSNLTKGTKPSNTVWTTSWITFESSGTEYKNRLGELRSCVDANGTSIYEMLAYSYNTGASDPIAYLSVCSEMGGSVYVRCPTPPANSNDTKIATTAWVTAKGYLTSHQSLSNYVTLNGDQTISGAKTFTGDVIGINKNDSTENANDLYSTTAGSKLTYYTLTNGGTKLTNVPAAVNTTLESRTIRRLSDSDWIVEQICHNSNGLYYRKGSNGTWGAWKTFAFTDSSISGNAATATKATGNANGKELTNTIIKGLSISGKTITYTQIDGNTGTLTTQDTNTDTLMTQNVSTTNATYPVLLVATADATANQGSKTGIFAKSVKVNPSTNVISASGFSGPLTGNVTGNCSGSSGSCTGNAATATQFSANTTVALTGDATGTSAGSKKGWSVPVTLANSGVTAGTYGPSADVTGNNNATISVPQITVDAKGRVTSVTNRTLTCKNNTYTVNNATLTIQKNGTNVATFTSNASANATANITVPTKVSELTNDAGYLTSHQDLSLYPYKVSSYSSYGNGRWPYIDLGDTTTHPNGFNEIVATGKYQVRFTSSTPNSPYTITSTANDGILEIEGTSSAGSVSSYQRVVQRFYKYNSAHIVYFRAASYHDGQWNWSDWTSYGDIVTHNASEFLTSHQSLAGYLPLTGGTMTGDLNGTNVYVSGGFAKKHASITKGTNPSATSYWTLTFADKNGVNYSNNCLGMLETSITTGGVVSTYIRAMKNTAANSTCAQITAVYDTANSTAYATCPTPAANSNDTKIATTAWVVAKGYLTSHQSLSNYSTLANTVKSLSISGKTITVTPGSGSAYTLTTQDTVYTHPTSAGNKHIPSGGSSGQFLGWDSDGTAKWVNNPNTNTDTLMTQNVSTTNATYPVLLVATADATANQGAKTGIFAKSVKVNPSTNVISASGFSGPLTGNVTGNVTGNCSGTSANVTGTVAIANGGTGATSRLNAVKALTNENVGTGTNYFLTITSSWGKAGYCSVADAKTVLGLGSAAYTASTAYAAASHSHSDYLTKTTNVSEIGRYIDFHYDNATMKYDYDVRLEANTQGSAEGKGVFKVTADSINVPTITTSGDVLRNDSRTRGTAPSSALSHNVGLQDSAKNKIGLLQFYYGTDMSSKVGLFAYKTTVATGNNIGQLSIGCDTSGNVYTIAPTPATADNSTQIATTAFVKAQGYSTTDTKVSQTVTTTDSEYPILAMTTASATETETNGARFSKGARIGTRYGILISQNTYNSDCYLGSTSGERSAGGIYGRDYNNANLFKMQGIKYASGRTAVRFDVYNKITSGAYDTAATATNAYWRFNYDITGKYIDTDMACGSNWSPLTTNSKTLGTSSLQWKEAHAVNFYENGTALSSKYAHQERLGIGTIILGYVTKLTLKNAYSSSDVTFGKEFNGIHIFTLNFRLWSSSTRVDWSSSGRQVYGTWEWLGETIRFSDLNSDDERVCGVFRRKA